MTRKVLSFVATIAVFALLLAGIFNFITAPARGDVKFNVKAQSEFCGYITVQSLDLSEVEVVVNSYIQELDWQPTGGLLIGPSHYPDHKGATLFTQAIWKPCP